jgi:hypothetical protein
MVAGVMVLVMRNGIAVAFRGMWWISLSLSLSRARALSLFPSLMLAPGKPSSSNLSPSLPPSFPHRLLPLEWEKMVCIRRDAGSLL